MRTARAPGAPLGRRALALIALLVVVVAVVAAVAVNRFIRNSWDLVDKPAERLQVPASFRPEDSVRLGSANCFVTCVGGGEPVRIEVYSTSLETSEVCEAARRAVAGLISSGSATPELSAQPWPDGECLWEAPLSGGASIRAVVALSSKLGAGAIYWDRPTPRVSGPVVVWFTFYSGIE
jgi:hypothetical protein